MVNSFLPVEENIFKISTYTGWLKPQWKSNPITAWAQSMPSFLATRWMPLTIKQKNDDKNYCPSHIVEEAMTILISRCPPSFLLPPPPCLLFPFLNLPPPPPASSPPSPSLRSLPIPPSFLLHTDAPSLPLLTSKKSVFQEITREGRGGWWGEPAVKYVSFEQKSNIPHNCILFINPNSYPVTTNPINLQPSTGAGK